MPVLARLGRAWTRLRTCARRCSGSLPGSLSEFQVTSNGNLKDLDDSEPRLGRSTGSSSGGGRASRELSRGARRHHRRSTEAWALRWG
jgi:hypothetical protein